MFEAWQGINVFCRYGFFAVLVQTICPNTMMEAQPNILEMVWSSYLLPLATIAFLRSQVTYDFDTFICFQP